MNKSNLFILLLALLMNFPAKSQHNQVNFYPPQAASLMSKVDYPVTHLTGMPDIRIPLHTVTTSSFTIPVELSFHLDNFIKANTMPGSAGAGWSLNTELQISRSINGGDDLKSVSGYCFSTMVPSNYTNGFQSRTRSQMLQMVSGYFDEEPDKFFYQLLNKSGSFYFQKQANGTFVPVPVPFNGIKIDYNFTSKQFTIVDTDGTSYTFSTAKVDWSSDLNGTNSELLSWKCESIKNAAGVQEINFTYANSYEKTESSFRDRQEIFDDLIDYVTPNLPSSPFYCNTNYNTPPPVPFWQITGAKQVNYGGTASSVSALDHDFQFLDIGYYPVDGAPSLTYRNVKNHLVTEIGFRDGSIAFNYVNQEQLSSIVVKNNAGVAIKTVNLMQSYNGSAGSSLLSINTYRHSRKLDSIRINDQSWSFTYGFNRQYGTVSDFWGYEAFIPSGSYVTVPTQTAEISMGNYPSFYDCWSNIPAQSGNVTIGQGRTIDVIFELHENQTKAFTINYPTGGRTEFMVGQNRFRDPDDGTIKGAGGYRVEKILNYDAIHTTPASEKIYKYGINEDGAGIVKTKPNFDPYTGNCFLTERIHYGNGDLGTFTTWYDVRKRTFLSGATRSLTFSNGAVVNYNTVTEYNADLGVLTGKRKYTYDLNSYSPPYTSPTDPFPFERNDWDTGRPDSVIDYKYSNGTFAWVRKQIMNYNTFLFPYKIFQGRASLRGDAILLSSSSGTSQSAITEKYGNLEYKYDAIVTGVNQLTSEQEIVKDDNGNTLTNQTSYFYTNPDPSVVTRKEKLESNGHTTTEHVTYPADYSTGGFITSLIQNNIVSVPIERVIRRNGLIVSGNLSTYNSSGTLATNYAIESSPPLAQSAFRMSNKSAAGDFTSATPNVAYNRDPNYVEKLNLTWDNYLNLLQVSPVNNTAKSYIWNYNKVYPVAEVVNASAGLIAYTSFETDDHGGWSLTPGGTIGNNNIITGKKIYSGGLSKTVPQGNYTVTAWAKGNITVNGSAGTTLIVSKRDGNWRLLSWELTNVTSIQILADFVDEVRLYPPNAMMTTYTYDPVVGMTGKCDAANGITYFEYDSSGRLSVIRDQDFKIIKVFDYKYKTP